MTLPPFPDAELLLLDLLEPIAGDGTTVTHTDTDLAAPCVQVMRTGGRDDGVTDRARMQITCYGADRRAAWELSARVAQVVLAAGGTAVTGDYVTNVLIDSTATIIAGRELGQRNPDLRIVISEFWVSFRRPWSV
ncbi:phage tail termination protein [Pseudonocardia asaccharolytica]|uniref:DUF3168 domain-containing protein n=1 Tax=Pseudonocardia asaccharolytica DSM 44247 = NBRC 16224 TaxID=1123024 RepID=A0A511D3K5_9PSEU|nr:hypothetical protein [Pseudonocardia asaccharolytica]GEL19360.1 hypothetical protein PA7_31970 [Pseudonocardia asaccharolytica DSM 44247 = NBRC 16224]